MHAYIASSVITANMVAWRDGWFTLLVVSYYSQCFHYTIPIAYFHVATLHGKRPWAFMEFILFYIPF